MFGPFDPQIRVARALFLYRCARFGSSSSGSLRPGAFLHGIARPGPTSWGRAAQISSMTFEGRLEKDTAPSKPSRRLEGRWERIRPPERTRRIFRRRAPSFAPRIRWAPGNYPPGRRFSKRRSPVRFPTSSCTRILGG